MPSSQPYLAINAEKGGHRIPRKGRTNPADPVNPVRYIKRSYQRSDLRGETGYVITPAKNVDTHFPLMVVNEWSFIIEYGSCSFLEKRGWVVVKALGR